VQDILRAIVLGIVQGLTEFLPISSSGHLIVARELFGWDIGDDLTFDVALHLGTTAAVLAYFWREWLAMARASLRWIRTRSDIAGGGPYNARLLFLLALGTIPAGIAGLFESTVEDSVRSPLIVGIMLIVFGALLYLADQAARGRRAMADVGPTDALAIGIGQAIALIPGVSRSGITISTGLALGFTRDDAARFAFLLSTPVILAAGALQLGKLYGENLSGHDYAVMATGAVTAAIVGVAAIAGLLRLIRAGSFTPFVIYRIIAGVFIISYFVAI
jgi:undecaprenyl-diphosphatase